MITTIGPEHGGESEGILRVDLSLPIAPHELRSLQEWFTANGWSLEADAIDDYFNSQYMQCSHCGRIGSDDDGIELGGECQDEECPGTILAVEVTS